MSSMLVPPESSSAVLVMIRSKSVQGRHAVEIFWGAREMSRPDDGGTEGPERGAGGAKRRSAEGGVV